MSEQKQTEGVPVVNVEGLALMGTPYDDRARTLKKAADAMSQARGLSNMAQRLQNAAARKQSVRVELEFDDYVGKTLRIKVWGCDPVALPLEDGGVEELARAALSLAALLEVAADARATEAQALLKEASGDQG